MESDDESQSEQYIYDRTKRTASFRKRTMCIKNKVEQLHNYTKAGAFVFLEREDGTGTQVFSHTGRKETHFLQAVHAEVTRLLEMAKIEEHMKATIEKINKDLQS